MCTAPFWQHRSDYFGEDNNWEVFPDSAESALPRRPLSSTNLRAPKDFRRTRQPDPAGTAQRTLPPIAAPIDWRHWGRSEGAWRKPTTGGCFDSWRGSSQTPFRLARFHFPILSAGKVSAVESYRRLLPHR